MSVTVCACEGDRSAETLGGLGTAGGHPLQDQPQTVGPGTSSWASGQRPGGRESSTSWLVALRSQIACREGHEGTQGLVSRHNPEQNRGLEECSPSVCQAAPVSSSLMPQILPEL